MHLLDRGAGHRQVIMIREGQEQWDIVVQLGQPEVGVGAQELGLGDVGRLQCRVGPLLHPVRIREDQVGAEDHVVELAPRDGDAAAPRRIEEEVRAARLEVRLVVVDAHLVRGELE